SILGFKAQVIRTRGNSADVFAESSKYKIVGDAKTFRLSRTAKNQKDFKVESLNSWRRENDYAVLVAPQNHFPSRNSAIYEQSIEKNVTLLSYAHLYFLMQCKCENTDYESLWKVGRSLNNSLSNSNSARNYWNTIDTCVLEICDKTTDVLTEVKSIDKKTTQMLGREGIEYWEGKINQYNSLSKEEAIRLLLQAEKIESKIMQIQKAIGEEL
ncbi:MAG: HindIII family type II restriction endonuclease, partial [Thermoguttaceae bacterium]